MKREKSKIEQKQKATERFLKLLKETFYKPKHIDFTYSEVP